MRMHIASRLRAPSGMTVVGVLAAALVSGCSGSPSASPTSPGSRPDAQSTTAPDPGLTKYYGQQLSWSSCRSGDECSWLTVPLDYAHPQGATIKLALLKVPAADKGERIGSLVVNPGGPGGSGIDYAAEAKQAFRAPLRDHFDIVGFDPRGVGKSDPVDCVSDAQLDRFIAQDQSPDTPAEVKTYTQANQAMADGCAKSPVAAHISTVDAARDVDVLRAALGSPTSTTSGPPTAPSSARRTPTSSLSGSGASSSTVRSTRRCAAGSWTSSRRPDSRPPCARTSKAAWTVATASSARPWMPA